MKINRFLILLLTLSFLFSICFLSSAEEVSEGKLIQAGVSIGEFTLSSYNMNDIKEIFGEPDTKRTEGISQPEYVVIGYADQARAFGFDLDNYILEILVTSNPVDYTQEGFHVGSNIEEVKKVYNISQEEGGHEWIEVNESTIEKVRGKVDDYKLEQLINIPSIGTAYHAEGWDTILERLQFTSSEIETIKSSADKRERITYMSDGIKFVADGEGTIVTIIVSRIFK